MGGGHFYHGRIGSVFNVSRHFLHPRDDKFCDEQSNEGLVFITSLLEEKDWPVVETLSWFLSLRL